MEKIVAERDVENALEKLALVEAKVEDAIAIAEQEEVDTKSFIRNKSSVSQSANAKKRRRLD